MKKLFLTLTLLAMAAVSYGQGTIQFLNGALTRHQPETGATRVNAPVDIPLVYGIFVGATADSLSLIPNLPLATPSLTTPGVMAGVGALYAITGFDTGSRPFAQVRAWDVSFGNNWQAAMTQGRFYGQTDVRQIDALGLPGGPATVIWQGATGTIATRFNPIIIHPVPEPSTIALGVLGLGSLLLFRRRQAK